MEDSDVPPEMGSQTLLDPHQIKTTSYCGPATGYQELELPGVSSLIHMRAIILSMN